MIKVAPFDLSAISPNTVFITHASYEFDRSIYIPKILNSLSSHLRATIVIANSRTLNIDTEYQRSLKEITALLTRSNLAPPIARERSDLIGMLTDLIGRLTSLQITDDVTFFVDSSAFPKDRLWVVLDLIGNMFPINRLILGYTEPATYNTEEDVDGWLSKGVAEVGPILGFNGRQDPTKPTLLIVNVGHENERVTITINNREPQKIILLAQSTNQHNDISHTTALRILNGLIDNYGTIVEHELCFTMDSKDILSVRNSITSISKQFEGQFNISVAMFGTKLQSIGAFLSCRENRRIEAIYAKPQIYHREKYSRGTGGCWTSTIFN